MIKIEVGGDHIQILEMAGDDVVNAVMVPESELWSVIDDMHEAAWRLEGEMYCEDGPPVDEQSIPF